jgi:hypothetical protein
MMFKGVRKSMGSELERNRAAEDGHDLKGSWVGWSRFPKSYSIHKTYFYNSYIDPDNSPHDQKS